MASSPESSVAPSPPPTVPVDFKSLLELNLAYQDLIQKLLEELETIASENNELQQEAAEILVIQARNPKVASRSFSLPYFVDSDERTPPMSEDKKVKDALGIRPLVPVKKWSEKEYVLLQEAVFLCVKRAVLARLLIKKNSLEQKLAAIDECTNRALLEEVEQELSELESSNKMNVLERYKNERVDWLCISVVDFAGRRTDVELEQMWLNYIWPNLSNPPWDKESIERFNNRLKELPHAPSWDLIAEEFQKHVFQCWELSVQNNAYTIPLKVSDKEAIQLYKSLKTIDFVPWVKLADLLQLTAPSKAIRRVETALTVRKSWILEEDIYFILALYLYRGVGSYENVLKCLAGGEFPRTASQCYGRLYHLLGTLAFGAATKIIEGYKFQPRRPVPKIRKKANMIPWLLSTLMSIVDKVRITCFLHDDPQDELRRLAPKIAKNCLTTLNSRRRNLASDTLDFSIAKLLSPTPMNAKPSVVPGIKTVHSVMLPVIEKNILSMDSTSHTELRMSARTRKVHDALDSLTRHNLLPPCSIMVEPTNGMLRRSLEGSELDDKSTFDWIEGELETSQTFQTFERAFNSMFAMTVIASEVQLPEVKHLRSSKEPNRSRKGITFKRKRGVKKPWIKARWKRFREMKSKEGQSENADEDSGAENQEEAVEEEEEEERSVAASSGQSNDPSTPTPGTSSGS